MQNKRNFKTTIRWPVFSPSVIAVALTCGIIATETASSENKATQANLLLWGDTHLHTNQSVDAFGLGNRYLTPDDAYRFAKGEPIKAHTGEIAQLKTPLDFILIADHAVNMGVLPALRRSDPLLNGDLADRWTQSIATSPADVFDYVRQNSKALYRRALKTADPGDPAGFFWKSWTTDYFSSPDFRKQSWDAVCEVADEYNQPGVFTAFIGFEWTPASISERSPNFHRNVLFSGDAGSACQVLPFTVQDSENVEQLWKYLNEYEELTQSRVLAIPHNANLSKGRMFKMETYLGSTVTSDYLTQRARWEPLYEVTQIKGDSETHPTLSPDDPFADFETWHKHGFFGVLTDDFNERKRYEYARSALQIGLQMQKEQGINPLKFGLIGSSDAHTSLSSVAESNFWGKVSLFEPSALRLQRSWHYSASGLAAVWAASNTREDIFDAMVRKEVYATTGTRIQLRFFGGWEFEQDSPISANLAEIGYGKGVAMGGTLPLDGPDAKGKPTFIVAASMDPNGANLDRIQLVKGWLDDKGVAQERVFNIALGKDRMGPIGVDGVSAVGDTVDIDNASYTNTIGSPTLSAVWRDEDFNPQQEAFYYIRVLEIPTPRWSAFDKVRFGWSDEDLVETRPFGLPESDKSIPLVIQERAYSSPIWFTPYREP